MSEQKPSFLLPVVGAALLAAGGAGAYFYFNQGGVNVLPVVKTSLAIAKVVPKQALMLTTFSTGSDAWAQLDQFQSAEAKKLIQDAWQGLQKQTFTNTGLNYEKDVKPWAGDIAIAFLSTNSKPTALIPHNSLLPVSTLALATPKPATKFDVLFVFEVKNKDGANQFADKVATQAKTKANGKSGSSEYKGIKIVESSFGNGNKLNSAPIGNYLVFSSELATLKTAIDTFNGGASLEPDLNPGELNLQNPLMQLYVNDFGGSLEKVIANSPNPNEIPKSSIDQLKALKSLHMGIGVDKEGLRLKGSFKYDPKFFDYELKTTASKILAQFPSETFAITNGADLRNAWNYTAKNLEKNPDTKKGLADLRKSLKESPVALDLDKDIFGWMDGEYGIGAIASDKGLLAQIGAAPAFMIQSSDRKAADATIKKLTDFAQKNGVTIKEREVKGVKVTEWIQGVPIMVHGWNQDILFVSAEPLSEILVGNPSASLASNANFKSLTGTLSIPSNNNLGYFYFDIAKAWEIYNKAVPAQVRSTMPPATKTMIESMRGIVGSAIMTDKVSNQFEVLLALKPKPAK